MAATATDPSIVAVQKENATLKKELADLGTQFKNLNNILARMPAPGTPAASDIYGARARTGEDIMSSRGFSFMKMLGVMTGVIQPENAKHELDIHRRLHAAVSNMNDGFQYGGIGTLGLTKFLAPLSSKFLNGTGNVDSRFAVEMKSMVEAGVEGGEQGHMSWISKQLVASKDPTVRTKALSWLNELSGGALVAPPEQGELIELLRNKEALVNAGARTVPLPPQGRMKYPRQTSPSTTYWVGENSPIPDSNIGTGEVTLQAKKLAVLIKAPNELIRFASPAAEALMRDDMTKSLALGLDLAGLEGPGTDNTPRGLINMPNINIVQSSQQGANGNSLVGQDCYRMIAAIEESNAEFEGWVMRPKLLYKYYQLRSDAVGQGDSQGQFLFNLIREAGAGTPPMLAGFPVTKSTQVSQVQSKGTASNLTYQLGGMWSDLLIGMFGAIEFAATTQGDTAFQNDQTWVRGILSADIQARHESAFAYMPNLIVNA